MEIIKILSYYILIGSVWSACLDILAWSLRTHLKMSWIPEMTNTLRIVNILLWPLCIIVFMQSYWKERT